MNHAIACLHLALAVALPLSAAEKTSVAVMSLKHASGVTADDAELLSDRLRIELFNTDAYTVMERSQMQEILKEQGFQQSGTCTDEGCMVEMGQMLGVRLLIGGSIGRLGNMYLVNLRAIDIRSAKISAVVSEDIPGSIEMVVKALPGIAARLAGGPTSKPRVKAVTTSLPPDPLPVDPSSSPPPPPVEAPPIPACKSKVYLELPEFTAQQLNASLTPQEMQRLNEDVADELESVLDECLYDDVDVAARSQIAAMSGCGSIVIRVTLNEYSTKPGTREQFYGTANVNMSFYAGVDATTPFHTEQITETGSQHWGEYEPFQNAFEEIAETIEGQDLSAYMRDVRARIRKL